MKRILVLAVMLLCVPPLAVGDAVVPSDAVESYINIRSAPDANSEAVGRLQHGQGLPLVGTTERWYEVQVSDDQTGFVHKHWSRVVAEPTEVAEDAEPVPAVDEEPLKPVVEAAEPEPAVEEEPAPVVEAAEPEPAVEEEPEPVVEAAEPEPAVEEEPEPVAEVAEPEPAVEEEPEPVVEEIMPAIAGPPGPPGPAGEVGPMGLPGPAGKGDVNGTRHYVGKFTSDDKLRNSQIYDNGTNVGIGTNEPKQVLEVNGNIQIANRSSNSAALLLTQASGGMGYIMHNLSETLTIGAGSEDRITIDSSGNVGIGKARPSQPLDMASGAYVTAGGVWTDASSRDLKENIVALTLDDALSALEGLTPVRFNYRVDSDENHVGFIAEDVPDLVASKDHKGLSPMDIVAVLTTVVREQQRRINGLEEQLENK